MSEVTGPNHIEQFEALSDVEYRYNPALVDGLRSCLRRRHISHQVATSILEWASEGRTDDTVEPRTSHTECHLRLVGSEEVGTEYIDYGDSDDAA